MKHQNTNNTSESSSKLTEKTVFRVPIRKIDSPIFEFFKYWLLFNVIWTLKDILSPSGIEIPWAMELSHLDETLEFISKYPLRIWETMNCLLVIEGLRRKNVQILEITIKFLWGFLLSEAFLSFFSFTTRVGQAVLKKGLQEVFKHFKGETNTLICIAAIYGLFWGVYFYYAYIYGAKKAIESLDSHKKIGKRL